MAIYLTQANDETKTINLSTLPRKRMEELVGLACKNPETYSLLFEEETEDPFDPSNNAERFTIVQWAESQGITLDTGNKARLSRQAAKDYQREHGKKPGSVHTYTASGNPLSVTGYSKAEFPILLKAWGKVLNKELDYHRD